MFFFSWEYWTYIYIYIYIWTTLLCNIFLFRATLVKDHDQIGNIAIFGSNQPLKVRIIIFGVIETFGALRGVWMMGRR